jgi:hypothetical protein
MTRRGGPVRVQRRRGPTPRPPPAAGSRPAQRRRNSVERGLALPVDDGLQFGDAFGGALLAQAGVRHDALGEGWHVAAVRPALRLPEPRPRHRLGAVQERLLDVDDHRKPWQPAVDGEPREQVGVGGDAAPPRHPQHVAMARDEEDQGHGGVDQKVLEAVMTPVARPVGDHQGPFVEDGDEAGRVALGRQVQETVRTACRHDAERRGGDEAAADRIDPIDHLVGGPGARLARERSQAGAVGDGVGIDVVHGTFQTGAGQTDG